MSDTNLLEKQIAEVRSELASAKEDNVALRVASLEAVASKESTEAIV